jgi:tRNA (cytidine/uridine-2'-O-)-methyltransferase
MIEVVLVHPEIPPNTGNIARTCAATGSRLHLVEPLGFHISDRYLKRAGVDYWHLVEVIVHPSWAALPADLKDPDRLHLFTSRGGVRWDVAEYGSDPVLCLAGSPRASPAKSWTPTPGPGAASRCVRASGR